MSVLRILSVGADGTMLIDWGDVVLNHYMPHALRENPRLPDAEALALIEAMRPAPVEPVAIPAVVAALLVEPDPAALERQWRDAQMAPLLAVRDRHRDEVELGIATTLTAEQFAQLLAYIQQLRDWPQSEQFPAVEHRPALPAWYQPGE